MARIPSASTVAACVPLFVSAILYCLRLPAQRGKPRPVGPEHADEHLIEVGALGVHADRQADRREHAVDGLDLGEDVARARPATCAPPLPELTSKYLPPLTPAMLFSSAVQPGPWPVVTLSTSTV